MESVLDRVIKQNTENVNLLKTKDYNIFSVLQIQSKEVLICRMIADLLNPRGRMAQGRVLKNFPERLSWNGKNGYKTGRSGNCDGRICD